MGIDVLNLHSSTTRHSREGGNPDFQQSHALKVWIPTFVGKTVLKEVAQ